MTLDNTKTLEHAIQTLQAERDALAAELHRATEREMRLIEERNQLKERNATLWQVVEILYRHSMYFRREVVKRIMPELSKLDVNHVSQSDR